MKINLQKKLQWQKITKSDLKLNQVELYYAILICIRLTAKTAENPYFYQWIFFLRK